MTTPLLNIDSISNYVVLPTGSDTVVQSVFLSGQTRIDTSIDTVKAVASICQQPASGHFLQQGSIPIDIVNRVDNLSGWLTIGVLLLTFVLTLVWYFFPERVLRLLSREGSKHKTKYEDNQFAKPGIILYFLLGITFIVSTSLFIYLLAERFFSDVVSGYTFEQIIVAIPVLILLYFLLRFLIIFSTGLLFNTQDLAAKQVRAAFRADLIQSFFLLPLLFVLLNIPFTVFYFAGIVLLMIIIVYKWGLTLYIGAKSLKISLYHNILYLCALEIVPVIILLKLMENYGLVFITS